MKKICLTILFILLLSAHSTYVDMNSYRSTKKSIEVKGEVVAPGVYEVDQHADVKEIIQTAGGIREQGDLSAVNLTLDLGNESVLVIPKQQEEKQISINSASQEELDSLPGIGPAIAQRIIEYRKDTPFQTIEDIKQVRGIKDALFEKIKEKIVL